MKKLLILSLVVIAFAGVVHAQGTVGAVENPAMAGNLFKNGDMSNGTMGWQGDRSFTADGDNRVLEVKANKNNVRAFTQTITTDKIKDLTIKYRYKSADYKGRGLQQRCIRGDGSSTYRDIEITADNVWHEVTWDFSTVNNSSSLKVVFSVKEGEGTVYFDDIIAKDKEAK